jgi:hypothetical protein
MEAEDFWLEKTLRCPFFKNMNDLAIYDSCFLLLLIVVLASYLVALANKKLELCHVHFCLLVFFIYLFFSGWAGYRKSYKYY